MSSHQHFKIYKPAGYLSQFVNNQNKRRNKKLLGSLGDFPKGTMSVGRLDENSEGLLFLTTDGKVSFDVCSRNVEKEYYVQVDGNITKEATELLKKGVEITSNKEKYTTLPSKAIILDPKPQVSPPRRKRGESHGPTSWVSITINEGKFRQIRKMTAAVGFPTLRLIRVRIGSETLGGLLAGEVKEVSEFKL
jgi:23S rRNA pseudouridine2457 synthase